MENQTISKRKKVGGLLALVLTATVLGGIVWNGGKEYINQIKSEVEKEMVGDREPKAKNILQIVKIEPCDTGYLLYLGRGNKPSYEIETETLTDESTNETLKVGTWLAVAPNFREKQGPYWGSFFRHELKTRDY